MDPFLGFFHVPCMLLIYLSIALTSLLFPWKGPNEAQANSSRIFSEEITFNYALATLGDRNDLPTFLQDSSNQGESRITLPFSSFSLDSQSVSSEHRNLHPRQPTSAVEKLGAGTSPTQQPVLPKAHSTEAPSYIIHEPALSRNPVGSKDTSRLPHHTEQVSSPKSQSLSDNPNQSIVLPPITFPQRTQSKQSFQFYWPIKDVGISILPAQATTLISHHVPGRSDYFNDSKSPQLILARYSRVFDPEWEPLDHQHPSDYGTIPLIINDAVAKNLQYFQKGITERFQTYLDRFHHYQAVVEPIFREFGLPTELMYLSLVESGFNPKAYSRARASGPWQFMKSTGRLYKLQVNWYMDERRDPIKSTVAAAHHLRDLYDQFGSWPLALGAYNAGSGKILRAIKKTRSRDFWKIRRTRYIRRETKEYVPRFLAAVLIAKDPVAYGFQPPSGDRHEFEEVLIRKPVHLSAITEKTRIPFKELQRLNPELRRSIIPKPKDPGYYLKVPVGMASLVEEHHQSLPLWTQPPPPPTQWYRVRRGDSLSVVAKRFRMKVSRLKAMNNLSSNLIRVGTKLRVRGEWDDYPVDKITWYRVRRGDSLGRIANRFRTSVKTLKRLNNLSNHLIHPGTRLRIRSTSASQQSNIRGSNWYTVRYGDSLGSIANRFGKSVRTLKKLNNLSSHMIFPGDRLRIREGTAPLVVEKNQSKWYRVREGDSLWSIAKQFSVSVRDLRVLNNLSSSIIRAGHTLLITQ